MSSDYDQVREEVQLLYPLYLQDIENVKQQQWKVAYYLVIIQGAIIGFEDEINKFFLIIASITITILSYIVIYMYSCDLKTYRIRKEGLKELFTDEVFGIFELKEKNGIKQRKKVIHFDVVLYCTFTILEIVVLAILIWLPILQNSSQV